MTSCSVMGRRVEKKGRRILIYGLDTDVKSGLRHPGAKSSRMLKIRDVEQRCIELAE